MTHPHDQDSLEGIAVIGMSGRFPGAKSLDQFWQNLVNGVESISRFREEELEYSVASPAALARGQKFIGARAILDDVDRFDAELFGIYPREAELMDPQHRLFLECAWEAVEIAGYDPGTYPGLIGVYAGLSLNTYLLYNLCANRRFAAGLAGDYQVGSYQVMLGNDKDFLPTRVSYKLNLKGPSMAIQTACSTSLVAVCQACTSLLSYQCDMALAGGVSISFPQKRDYLYQEEAMVSADGTCRVFDAEACGTVFGHGVAVVLLKRLADAVADRDPILAVIKGTALNNDGSRKIGYAAPSVKAQAEVIALAQAVAGIDPETVSYIEAHGTATPLGDPVEIAALTQAFRTGGAKRNGYCAIGTCKTHIGHLDVAAGATGLIKTILQLQHGLIPPLLHFKSPSPKIDFANSPFFPVTKLTEWKKGDAPRRAGVSAFGVGGTNAHVVVEEAPLPAQGGPSRPYQLLVLSARSQTALGRMAENLAEHLEKHPEVNLADVAFTLQRGRKPFPHRLSAVASGAREAAARLRSDEPGKVHTGKAIEQEPSIVFLFPGQGAQHIDMGRELYEGEPVFHKEATRCAQILRRHLDLDLCEVLYPHPEKRASVEAEINETWLAQPAIFMVEYALARLWMSWGVSPGALIGHSIGEYVAAVLAESLTLEDALGLVAVRARLMQDLPGGSMLTIRSGAEHVETMLPDGVSIAAINSPALCAVSGPTELLQRFQKELESKGLATRFLHTSHAFHSAMMDPMLDAFAAEARRLPGRPPKLPWVSTCTGRWMSSEDLADGQYWVRQVRQTVRFAEALDPVIEDSRSILLEVGPGQTLSQLARQHRKKPEGLAIIPTSRPSGELGGDLASMLTALGRLWLAGVKVNWEEFSGNEERMRVALPTYPFERKRYWIEPAVTDVPDQRPQRAPSPASLYPQEEKQAEEPEMQTIAVSNTCAATCAAACAAPARKDRLIDELRDLFHTYSGGDHSQADANESFMDLGFDSLLLTQVSQGVLKRFGVKVTFRQMLEDLCTLNSLAAFLDGKLPPEPPSRPASLSVQPVQPMHSEVSKSVRLDKAPCAPVTAATPSPPSSASTRDVGLIATVIQQQMSVMTQQLNLLRQVGAGQEALANPLSLPNDLALPNASALLGGSPSGAPSREPVVTAVKMGKESRFGPFKAIEKGAAGGLTARQQTALDTLIARYNRRTAKSKALAQEHRSYFCDPRAAGNFRQMWKEMVYPIICARSKGSRIWDVDGNEYIDVTMGFGANYLGHSPDFVMSALAEQMELGVEIGPQSPMAGEVARMICRLTGMDRATFCNTGSEAVMAAFRVARTVTGREKIVYFYGDYHGIFDEVLGRPALIDDLPGAMPIAPGIPHLANVMILEYGSTASLDTIRKHAGEIAAVIVEPVQSRHPDLQPREFLQELRRLTRDHDIALVFDEVITGFRVAPGGAQEYFGVKADLATYGKVIGGGMPIGVLAGSATYMDALDGGFWQYGDDSSPPTGVTFFAGTFVRHPLAMAAAHAVLKHLELAGPSLQERANRVTARFVDRLNDYFLLRQLPMRLQLFSAMFYYDFHSDLKHAPLLFYYLRDRGIHIWEGRVGHLSIAHTDEDMDRVLEAFQESIEEMQAGGFLPESDRGGAWRGGQEVDADSAEHGDLKGKRENGSGRFDPCRFPLAEAQREMWLGAQMRPEAAGPHHACTGLYLDGPLDLEMLRRAISEVVQRHEGLRCTFSEDGTEVILHPSMTLDVPFIDLCSLDDTEREARVNEIMHQEGKRLFDLVTGPLVGFQVLGLAPLKHLLIFTAQMIVCDGWSHYVVFEDLGAFYTSFASGVELVMAPAAPMREYARWEQANAGTDEARECEVFWLSRFKTTPPLLDLPTSRPRPPVRTFDGDRRELTLPPELYDGIKRLAKAQKSSYFAVLLSAFQVWLHRLSGARDMVVGVPFAAQGQLGMDTLVGQCANTLPLRAQVAPDELFSSVLKKTWSSVLDAQEHWAFTYGRLMPRLDLPRDPSRIPLVSVLFNIDPPMAKVKLGNLKHQFVTGPRYYYQYDLGFNLVEDESTIRVECDYNSNLFDEDLMECWVAGYQALLQAVVDNPDQPISRLPMLDEAEARRLVAGEEATVPAVDSGASIHSLIEAQAALRPDAVAATCEGSSLTYGELDRRAHRLGSHLQAMGVGPEIVVGVCLERSLDMPAALLAILKAGGAYALLEPSLPKEALSDLSRAAGVRIMLTDSHTASLLPETTGRLVLLDKEAPTYEMGMGNGSAPLSPVDPDCLACVLFKPHGNGKPEGIEISHRAAVNLLLSMGREPGLASEDVVLCHSPLCCHLELFELWLPLTVGARIDISPGTSVLAPEALGGVIDARGITVMQATPSAWRMLLASGWKGSPRLKVLCSGEPLQTDLAAGLAGICREVWSLYGAAEATVWSMAERVHAGTPVTLGNPVDNTHVVLADEHFELPPIGAPGEILISGLGLARGYRNLHSLTSERFVTGTMGGHGTNRLYRTGDMGRYRPGGGIELIGPRDLLVRVRGCQVDLGEIESVLLGHAGVRDVAVCYREDLGDKAGLAAYIVAENGCVTGSAKGSTGVGGGLRRLIRGALPEYMHPARLVVLDALPREADGRVDRRALPTPPEEEELEFEDYVAPRDQMEAMLAEIWRELLNLPKVSIRDSFFDLSGNSLLAVKLFNRIEKEFKRKLPLAMLFRAPTIEQLALELTVGDGMQSRWPSLVPIQTRGAKPPLFLAHGAGGNVLLYSALAKRLEPDYPLYGLQSQGLDGESKPLRTIEEMAVRYLHEIRAIQPRGPYLLGGYCLGGTVAYEMAQRLLANGESVALVAMLDTYNFSRALSSSFASFLLQKLRFHWGNFVRLRPLTMWRYLREKKRIASDGGWAHIRTEMPGSTLQGGVARAESGIEASVQEINDHAADIYTPKSYSGVLTIFKPHINYKFYPDPRMGWGDLALGGLDIVELPINPHAMLVEPYVGLLASELKSRLDLATGLKPGGGIGRGGATGR